MKTRRSKEKRILIPILMAFSLLFSACDKSEERGMSKGEVRVQLTDAPSDDANIQGVFMTVAAVAIDGELILPFEKQTIEVSGLTNGKTELLVADNIEAKQYSEIELYFDYESDASGASPGCYVLATDGKKHNLATGREASGVIALNRNFEVKSNGSTEIVVDVDLRKTIKRVESAQPDDKYEFVAQAGMQSAVRACEVSSTGNIEGEVDMSQSENGDIVVVYAYKKGAFKSTESEIDSETGLRYTNCVTSAKVDANGRYTLSFIEEGEYEIVAAHYRNTSENECVFESEANTELWVSGSLLNAVSVDAQQTVSVDLKIL